MSRSPWVPASQRGLQQAGCQLSQSPASWPPGPGWALCQGPLGAWCPRHRVGLADCAGLSTEFLFNKFLFPHCAGTGSKYHLYYVKAAASAPTARFQQKGPVPLLPTSSCLQLEGTDVAAGDANNQETSFSLWDCPFSWGDDVKQGRDTRR